MKPLPGLYSNKSYSPQKMAEALIIFLLIVLFMYTGMSKLLNREAFMRQLGKNSLLQASAGVISIGLPITEIFGALLLAIQKTRAYGLILCSALMILFTLYTAGMLMSHSQLPCTCGGVIASMSWKQHLIFNIIFTALAGYGVYLYKNKHNKGGS